MTFTDIEITGNDALMAEMVKNQAVSLFHKFLSVMSMSAGGSDLDALNAAGGLDPLPKPFLAQPE